MFYNESTSFCQLGTEQGITKQSKGKLVVYSSFPRKQERQETRNVSFVFTSLPLPAAAAGRRHCFGIKF